MVYLSLDNFKIKAMYRYPTYVQIPFINTYSPNVKRGDKDVKEFFNEMLEQAETLTGRKNLMDNKIAFKVEYTPTGAEFYVGYADNTYTIGFDIYTECSAKNIIKF